MTDSEKPELHLSTCIDELIDVLLYTKKDQLPAAQESAVANIPGLALQSKVDELLDILADVYRGLYMEYEYGEGGVEFDRLSRVLAMGGIDTNKIEVEVDAELGVPNDNAHEEGDLLPVGTKVRLLFSVNSFVLDPKKDEFYIPSGAIGELIHIDSTDESLPYYVYFDLTGMGLPLPEDRIWLFANDVEPV
jgi:hypothetical protein